jgi:adenylate kinase family enzyme/adenine/guanine phosphoribosyltransferase-like PRPP-binding protein
MKIVLLTGAPGSGKSTQGKGLSHLNKAFVHLSLGDIVRQKLESPDDPITQQYKEVISQGLLLPDECIFKILEQVVAEYEHTDVVLLLDGYPRTETQYQQFKQKWGLPEALIHLDIAEETLQQRLAERQDRRSDDNQQAIKHRLDFYQQTTKPLIEQIKSELGKSAITINGETDSSTTSLYLYAKLQYNPSLHEVVHVASTPYEQATIDPTVKQLSSLSILSQAWKTGTDEYAAIAALQEQHQTSNLSFSVLGKKITYLETPAEVERVLKAKSTLGTVYRQFSLAAGLKHDFVATDVQNPNSYHCDNGQVNFWKLIHNALSQTLKNDKARIEKLIDKHLKERFFAEKVFDLDKTFDRFFTAFWSEYLLGTGISLEQYQENRHCVLDAMRHCFYKNHYKALDPIGLTTWLYSSSVSDSLNTAKETISHFIEQSTSDSLVHRFKQALQTINNKEKLGLDDNTLEEIIADNVFDFIFEPDFLENVLYESLVAAVREHADLHDVNDRREVYNEGMQHGYLFPIRSRTLQEPVVLADGTELPAGSTVFLNLKKSGLYHSAGPRQCVGQAYTYYFREHLFNRLAPIEFKVKQITHPLDRQSDDHNVPISPERYQVSWRLRRDEAMRLLTSHDYKGKRFFDVLSLYQHPEINTQIVNQLVLKINRNLEKLGIDKSDVVIVTSETRGIPVASQVAEHLEAPLFIIRKQGGYKMAAADVLTESYSKGYGDEDVVELPKEHIQAMAGKHVIFLDDGIASGKSALACIRLIETEKLQTTPAKVDLVMALLKHDYVATDPKLSEHRLVKTLFDCRSVRTESESSPTLSTRQPSI